MVDTDQTYEAALFEDVAAEQVILGSLMLSSDLAPDILEKLRAEDFSEPRHVLVYATFMRRFSTGLPVDAYSMTVDMLEQPQRSVDASYLHHLVEVVPVSASALWLAEAVAAKALRRRLRKGGIRIVDLAHEAGEPVDLVDRAMSLISDLNTVDDSRVVLAADAGSSFLERMEAGELATGTVSCGIWDLDETMGLAGPGQVNVFAGRPGSGKSMALIQVARKVAIWGRRPFLFFSLEMSRDEVMARIFSAEARVSSQRLMRSELTEDEMLRIQKVRDMVLGAPLGIVDSTDISIPEIIAHSRRFSRKFGLAATALDYLQLVRPVSPKEPRQEQVSGISRSIKIGAKVLGCPFFVASQLNRGPEGRMNKVPTLSDMRESGAIENDADRVVLVHRPDYYDPMDRPHEVDFIVAKNRHGETSTVVSVTEFKYSRFRSVGKAPESETPPSL